MKKWTNEEVMSKTLEYTVSLGASFPVPERGKGTRVWDINGKEYIDCAGGPGVVNAGHCHPRIVSVIQNQAATLTQTTGGVCNIPTVEYAQKLAEITPGGLKKSFFSNSGAEAVDCAIKLAFKKAGTVGKTNMGVIALQGSFHGRASLPLALTGMTAKKKGFGHYASFPGVTHAPTPYCYRCPFHCTYPGCGLACAEALNDILISGTVGDVACFIAEPVMGVGGIMYGPEGYWEKISEICKKNDILIIADEIFAGFGRTGKMFSIEHWNVEPDIMCMAKALGGGLPLGNTICTEDVGNTMQMRDHYTTFGWNNLVAMRAGLEGVKIIEEENLVENSRVVGTYLKEKLETLLEKSDIVGDIRGKGLWIGVEIVSDKNTKAPDNILSGKLDKALIERGVIVSAGGIYGNVLRVGPPLILTVDEADKVFTAFEAALTDIGHFKK